MNRPESPRLDFNPDEPDEQRDQASLEALIDNEQNPRPKKRREPKGPSGGGPTQPSFLEEEKGRLVQGDQKWFARHEGRENKSIAEKAVREHRSKEETLHRLFFNRFLNSMSEAEKIEFRKRRQSEKQRLFREWKAKQT